MRAKPTAPEERQSERNSSSAAEEAPAFRKFFSMRGSEKVDVDREEVLEAVVETEEKEEKEDNELDLHRKK